MLLLYKTWGYCKKNWLNKNTGGKLMMCKNSRPQTWPGKVSPNQRYWWKHALLKFGHVHLCAVGYKCFSPHCFKCNSFGCTAAIRCGSACQGPSVYSGSEHNEFDSPRLVKHEASFPNPRQALIGSKQLWHIKDSPYYREYRNASVCVQSGQQFWALKRKKKSGGGDMEIHKAMLFYYAVTSNVCLCHS